MPTQYELLPRNSADLSDNEFKDKPLPRRTLSLLSLPLALLRKSRRICRPLYLFPILLALLLCQVTFNASYVNPPPFVPHPSETVYIAANIIDGDLIRGPWGKSLVELVHSIGKDRVYVSIYGGPTDALKQLESQLECESSIVSEEEHPIDLSTIPHTTLPTGEQRIKRIAYLAEVRNKALDPLATLTRRFDRVLFINDVFFSVADATRLLWGTNVNAEGRSEYKAVCAADFVTSWKMYDTYGTRDNEGYSIGVPIFPWFAAASRSESRDDVLAGKEAVRVKSCWGGMVAFDARYFQTQQAVTEPASDRRRVGDGVADVVRKEKPNNLPLRFRSEPEPFWDASECCLIHADIMAAPPFPTYSEQVTRDRPPVSWDDGVFMNPYVRVTYDAGSRRFVGLAKRFERLFALPQRVITRLAGLPRFNYRRLEREGDRVKDKVWVSARAAGVGKPGEEQGKEKKGVEKRATLGAAKSKEYWAKEGHYEPIEREATRGGYCGVRQLLVLKEGKREGGNWDNLLDLVPPLDM